MSPDDRRLGESLAGRLGASSGLAAVQLKGLTMAAIRQAFPYGIDPKILFFRKAYGPVVKADPAPVGEAPVPVATVQVENTDGSFLGSFPAVNCHLVACEDGPFESILRLRLRAPAC